MCKSLGPSVDLFLRQTIDYYYFATAGGAKFWVGVSVSGEQRLTLGLVEKASYHPANNTIRHHPCLCGLRK